MRDRNESQTNLSTNSLLKKPKKQQQCSKGKLSHPALLLPTSLTENINLCQHSKLIDYYLKSKTVHFETGEN
jgi:hypothetical protein